MKGSGRLTGVLESLPDWYWEVRYVGERYPGAVQRGELRSGGNCQLWAYEVLEFFGWSIPDLRSDDLWDDTTATELVDRPQPLDLVLYNPTTEPWGAHVGLVVEEGVAHLCREVGTPVIWPAHEFAARPEYSVRIGFKRPTMRSAS